MSEMIMAKVNEGDQVRLRSGNIAKVEFIAYMPDDLHIDYAYVVRLSGYEAATFTENGNFDHDSDSNIDIIEILENTTKPKSPFQFGYDAFTAKIQCAAHDQPFMDQHIKGLQVGESGAVLEEWAKGFSQAQEEYLKANFPEMSPS